MLIDYGYLKPFNGNTLQTVMKNKKIQMNNLHNHIGKADVTYLVNFNLLKEFFKKKKPQSKKYSYTKIFFRNYGNN